jgi:hypothetical protein
MELCVKKYILLVMVFALFIATDYELLAQEKTSIPVTFGATLFNYYSYTVQGIDGQDFNKFDIDRIYLTAKSQVVEDWKFQITTDIFRNTSAGTYYSGLAVRMKFAYLDYSPIPSLSLKAGMIPGPWNGAVEAFWKYRGIAQTANDKYGYIQTADIGVSATYSLPEKYGELAAYVFNGDGYANVEANKYKDVVFRASFVLFPNNPELKTLTLGGYTYLGKNGTAGIKKQRFGGLLGYSYSFVLVGAEYDSRKDGVANSPDVSAQVYSLFSEIKLPIAELQNKLSLIFRYDSADPNEDKDNDKTNFFIAGFVWKASEKISVVLDRQIMTADSPTMKTTAGDMIDKDEKWFVHTIVVF